jgi:hypothetical protein
MILLYAFPLTNLWYGMTATNDNDDDASHNDDTIMPISPSTSSLLLEYFGCPCTPDTLTNDTGDGDLPEPSLCIPCHLGTSHLLPSDQSHMCWAC